MSAASMMWLDVLLQWGHALPGVETRQRDAEGLRGDEASMGPRPSRRGDAETRAQRVGSVISFNGATPFQAWRPAGSPIPPSSQ